MRAAFFIVFFLMLSSLPASAQSIEAAGQVFYKMPSGELVMRDAVLLVPARGEGDVVLISGGEEAVAESFSTRRASGRTIFYVTFVNPPGAPEGAVVVFKGTYTRGTNLATYYGDFFIKTGVASFASDSLSLSAPSWSYQGGFWFKAPVLDGRSFGD